MRVGMDMDVVVPKREKRKPQRRQKNDENHQADKGAPGPRGDGRNMLFRHDAAFLPQSWRQIHPALKNTLCIGLAGTV
jgi:hypothetical protein